MDIQETNTWLPPQAVSGDIGPVCFTLFSHVTLSSTQVITKNLLLISIGDQGVGNINTLLSIKKKLTIKTTMQQINEAGLL